MPFGSGGCRCFVVKGSPAHVSLLSQPGTRPGVRPVITGTGRSEDQPSGSAFPSPFGRRRSLLGRPVPAEGLGLPHGRLTAAPLRARRTSTGFPRSAHTSRGRVGCPLYPGGRRCSHDRSPVLGRRLPTFSGWPLVTPASRPDPGSPFRETSARVYWHSPFRPSPHLWPPDGAGTLGLFPELRTRPLLATHVRAGTGLEHGPGLRLRHRPNLQST